MLILLYGPYSLLDFSTYITKYVRRPTDYLFSNFTCLIQSVSPVSDAFFPSSETVWFTDALAFPTTFDAFVVTFCALANVVYVTRNRNMKATVPAYSSSYCTYIQLLESVCIGHRQTIIPRMSNILRSIITNLIYSSR